LLAVLLAGCDAKEKTAETESDSARINSVEDLAGRKVATLRGSTLIEDLIKQSIPSCEPVLYDTVQELAGSLLAGEVDAYIAEESTNVVQNYPDLCVIAELGESNCASVFPKTEDGQKLCEQFNAFLEQLRADGSITEIRDSWLGAAENTEVPEISSLTGENGCLNFAVSTVVGAPFAFDQDGTILGYEIDLAFRFCREYGYALNITDYDFSGLLDAVQSGRADMGASCITVTEQRREILQFSESTYSSTLELVVRSADTDIMAVDYLTGEEDTELAERFAGKTIAALTGTIHSETISYMLPESKISFYNNVDDIAEALENGEIDGYVDDEPTARMYIDKYDGQYIVGNLETCNYAFAFPKDSEKSETLIAQMNAFLSDLKKSGDLEKIDAIWFGDDESKKVVNTASLTGKNGILNFAISSETAGVFAYEKDGEYVGYDVDIAVRFCERYGYGINIVDSNFSVMLASIAGGRCDFAGSDITITDARRKKMRFSEPNYYGSVVLISREYSDADTPRLSETSLLDALAGCKLGVLTGTVYDQIAAQYTPQSSVLSYNSVSDLYIALDSGLIDGYYVDLPMGRIAKKGYPDQSIYAVVTLSNNAMIFQKGSLESDILRSQINQYLAEIKADGTFREIGELWFGDDEASKTVDYASLTGENGVLNVATSSMIGEPFAYMKDGQMIGYDLDMICRFCREYGYGMQVVDYDFPGMLAAVTTGKADIGAACITITEEREEIMNFSDTNYYSGVVIVTKEGAFDSRNEEKSVLQTFFDRTVESFQKTFIRENRWKLFAEGLGITMCITLLSVLFGTPLGFVVFLGYRKNRRLFNRSVDFICDILNKMPTVLIVMILYYIVFVGTELNGLWVSVFGFSILFTCTVTSLLKVSVQAVPAGQREASLALGYTESQTFLKVILPQSIRQFLPSYKGEIVSLIKSTSIVGYIAVQDLTRISDLVRSHTFDPFFSLIVSAVIYILFASLLITLVERLQIRIDPQKRSRETIMKGVKTK